MRCCSSDLLSFAFMNVAVLGFGKLMFDHLPSLSPWFIRKSSWSENTFTLIHYIQFQINPFIKVTGCLSVCMFRRISLDR